MKILVSLSKVYSGNRNSSLLKSTSRVSTKTLLDEGKIAKIELYATTGDNFAERLTKFLSDIGSYTSGGASRNFGMLDPSDDRERSINVFVDGDGSDRILDVKLL